MKKLIGTVAMLLISAQVMAQDIQLPEPEQVGTMTLMEALKQRHSDRAFADRVLTQQELSNVLWAAYGVNREDGKRTIPTALNEKDLEIYVFQKEGIYRYDAEKNVLSQISDENKLELFQKQDYMDTVPAVLVYVGKEDYSALHAGSAYQNVGLYAASVGMANIARGMFDKDEVEDVLDLSDEQDVLISQAIGWPVEEQEK